MRVWRLCKAEHAATAFSGEGALLYPGRWHHAGTPIVYTAESRSLAVLEQLVHLARNRLPPHFVCFGVDVPDALVPPVLPIAELPAGWRSHPGPLGLRDLGTNWAQAGTGVCLAVPSAVVPAERNFLLNPRHPDFARLAIGAPEPSARDCPRLEAVARASGLRARSARPPSPPMRPTAARRPPRRAPTGRSRRAR